MGRLFDEEELKKYIMHDGCDKGCGYIDERDLKYMQTTEAIPKDQYEQMLKENIELINDLEELRTMINKFAESYENHLKADMIAMFKELHEEIMEMPTMDNICPYAIDNCIDRIDVEILVREKIDKLKERT